ncbi:glycoside hydrolase family 43 protein [Wenyingzhuangia marina]|uniref:Carbohydrate binding module (Family 6) n=1 Tax=Wenyingzhuangia marina TaxID=1195760 RepID=A0A1M5TU69_9FLAO|nr:glycoside hydrolase family 43 protein [Wenyingzhuangia marina]GGF71040.1 endo-1,4-beta-xylanase [Wenyingzhuangia marina]SHH54136.1 Carbohydrate binding module (family 6) [Wenyingzhuangia marina]
MHNKKTSLMITFCLSTILAFKGIAQNNIKQKPIIQTKYTADPAPMVYNDTVFLYTSHDEDDAKGFKMLDWLLYTSTDMVNWTEHGIVASLKDFSWARQDNGAWAIQTIERNGKFYMYCPMHGGGIGVLVSDSPYGPFKDPIGKKLIDSDHVWNDIDPSPFIDDDGQAYLYWGNPDVYYVKLNNDMISTSGEIVKEPTKPANYQEGPWVYKRNGHYYMSYASTCCPEGIGYAMSDSPTGPWEYKGMVVEASEKTRGNHPGIIDYKGKSYCFGHSYDLIKRETSTFYERRSVDMDEIFYNEKGEIETLPYWSVNGPAPAGTVNPFMGVEAETMAWSEGVKTDKSKELGIYVTQIHNGDYIQIREVDFSKGAKQFKVDAMPLSGGVIEIRIDDKDGDLLGVCNIKSNHKESWESFKTKIKKVSGIHDLYLVFKGDTQEQLFNIDKWKFKK